MWKTGNWKLGKNTEGLLTGTVGKAVKRLGGGLKNCFLNTTRSAEKINGRACQLHVCTKGGARFCVFTASFHSTVQSLSRVRLCNPMDCSTPGLPVHHQLPEFTQTHVHRVGDAIQPAHPLSAPSPPALNVSQHRGLFKSVSSSHQVAKVLEFQLQHQSFQWTPRTDLLQDGLVGSPCSSRDSQESSPTPQFKRIYSFIPQLKNHLSAGWPPWLEMLHWVFHTPHPEDRHCTELTAQSACVLKWKAPTWLLEQHIVTSMVMHFQKPGEKSNGYLCGWVNEFLLTTAIIYGALAISKGWRLEFYLDYL